MIWQPHPFRKKTLSNRVLIILLGPCGIFSDYWVELVTSTELVSPQIQPILLFKIAADGLDTLIYEKCPFLEGPPVSVEPINLKQVGLDLIMRVLVSVFFKVMFQYFSIHDLFGKKKITRGYIRSIGKPKTRKISNYLTFNKTLGT